jgi:cyclopropane fatty-acyl-phospholipid synthase-like methyltransferase
MQDQEFDTVLALDFIEHLTEPDAHDFLTEAKRVGHNVFIFTPLGPFEQDYGPDHPQTHRSAWTPEDFPDWRTYVLKDFHGRGRSAFWACWGEGRAT